jgi:hypothetical protein
MYTTIFRVIKNVFQSNPNRNVKINLRKEEMRSSQEKLSNLGLQILRHDTKHEKAHLFAAYFALGILGG